MAGKGNQGKNVGKPGSPGWQPTDKSKAAGKTPPTVTGLTGTPAVPDTSDIPTDYGVLADAYWKITPSDASYDERVGAYEDLGYTTSDAQAAVDAEDLLAAKAETRQYPPRPEHAYEGYGSGGAHNHFDKGLKDIGQCPACDLRFSKEELAEYYGPEDTGTPAAKTEPAAEEVTWKVALTEAMRSSNPYEVVNPVAPGDRITIPKGTLIDSFNPNSDGKQPAGRNRTVTIHHVAPGWIDVTDNYREGNTYVVLPSITWAGTGGWWNSVQLTPELCEANGITPPTIPTDYPGSERNRTGNPPSYEHSNRWRQRN